MVALTPLETVLGRIPWNGFGNLAAEERAIVDRELLIRHSLGALHVAHVQAGIGVQVVVAGEGNIEQHVPRQLPLDSQRILVGARNLVVQFEAV